MCDSAASTSACSTAANASSSSSSSDKKTDEHGAKGVLPHITCSNAKLEMEFMKAGLGGEVDSEHLSADGRVMHAAVKINGGWVMLHDEFPEWSKETMGPSALGGSCCTLHLNVEDADASIEKAKAAGATVVMPAKDQFWGDRYGVIKDVCGHRWSFSSKLKGDGNVGDPAPEGWKPDGAGACDSTSNGHR